MAEIHDAILAMSRGYNTPVGERGGNLSGGQRQRIAIARAILRDPKLLVLDEATSALDPATEEAVSKTLDKLATGRTIVSVTHRLSTVKGFHRIFVMKDGNVIESGKNDALVARRTSSPRSRRQVRDLDVQREQRAVPCRRSWRCVLCRRARTGLDRRSW